MLNVSGAYFDLLYRTGKVSCDYIKPLKGSDMAEHTIKPMNQLPNWLQKWRLLGLISAALILMAFAILALDPGVDGIRQVIRLTARTSLLLFCMAFIASAAWKRFPNAWTYWQRQNRRYLGLGFAVSHAIHAVAIISFAVLDPVRFHMASSIGNIISGGITYVFIILMSLTSFDQTAAWVGPRAWKILHTVGAYYIWISFLIAFGKRIPMSPLYILPLILLLAVLALRLWPASRQKHLAVSS
jgi:DMSO/TMAO reductase YedYZ heme-binding membrane subunit